MINNNLCIFWSARSNICESPCCFELQKNYKLQSWWEIHFHPAATGYKIYIVSTYLQLGEILSGEKLHKSWNYTWFDNFFNGGAPLWFRNITSSANAYKQCIINNGPTLINKLRNEKNWKESKLVPIESNLRNCVVASSWRLLSSE